jgi:hypothetical protein
MTAFAITITVLALAAVTAVIARSMLHESWGRVFDRDLDRFAKGGSWIEAGSTTEALSLDLIRRYDHLMAGASA